MYQQVLYYDLTLERRDIQLQQSLSVLPPIIPKANPKYLRFDIELIQKRFYFIYSYHRTYVSLQQKYNNPFEIQ